MFKQSEFGSTIHDGIWGGKFLLVLCIFVGSFWLDNESWIYGYMWVAKIVSVAFLIYQTLIIVSAMYRLTEYL
jgi:hypothetical protein